MLVPVFETGTIYNLDTPFPVKRILCEPRVYPGSSTNIKAFLMSISLFCLFSIGLPFFCSVGSACIIGLCSFWTKKQNLLSLSFQSFHNINRIPMLEQNIPGLLK